MHGLGRKAALVATVVFGALVFGQAAHASTPKIVPWPQGPSLASLVHHLNYYGGPVMAYDQNVLVLWGSLTSATSSGALNSFLTDMAVAGNSNPYNVPLEYGTQGLTGSNQPLTIDSEYSGKIQIAPATCAGAASCTVQDADVQNELNAQISAGHLPAPVQAFGGPVTYYSVLFPSNVQICMPGPSCSGVVFCAYHNTTYHGAGTSDPFMYGIIPDGPTTSGSAGCGAGTATQNLESYFSHELTETITDPEVGFAGSFAPPLAWYDPTSGGGEIGDICNAQESTTSINGHSYTVQAEWSNAANNCISTSPRTPGTPSFTVSGSGLTRSFNASTSTGSGLTYLWDFGDGATGTGVAPSHGYAAPGNKKVQLIITDSNNVSARKVATVAISAAHLTIAKTADQASINAGATAGFTVTLGNTGDGAATGIVVTDTLPAANGVTWTIADASAGWTLVGAPPSQHLVAATSLAGHASSHVHVTSATTNASCGTLNNSASVTSTAGGSGNASASVTVANCSSPAPKCVVPKVIGKSLTAAKTKIRKAHCSVGKITRKHASASKRGKVIGQSPKPGRRLKNHAKVNLTVGK